MPTITTPDLKARLAELVMARWNVVHGERLAVDIALPGRRLIDADIRAIDDAGIRRSYDGFPEHIAFDRITAVSFYTIRDGDIASAKVKFEHEANGYLNTLAKGHRAYVRGGLAA